MRPTVKDIDAILPQTQCGLCGYGGCMPYAKAMSESTAPLNLCPPGGVRTLKSLGTLLDINIAEHIPEMEQKEKPLQLVRIREKECIGCTKCIQACPVDAIIGTGKSMHTVLHDLCTGCELCIPPCPVDCIDLIALTKNCEPINDNKRNAARIRFEAREKRLKKNKPTATPSTEQDQKKEYIRQALLRVKQKRKR